MVFMETAGQTGMAMAYTKIAGPEDTAQCMATTALTGTRTIDTTHKANALMDTCKATVALMECITGRMDTAPMTDVKHRADPLLQL